MHFSNVILKDISTSSPYMEICYCFIRVSYSYITGWSVFVFLFFSLDAKRIS